MSSRLAWVCRVPDGATFADQSVPNLAPGDGHRTFDWDTTGHTAGSHTMASVHGWRRAASNDSRAQVTLTVSTPASWADITVTTTKASYRRGKRYITAGNRWRIAANPAPTYNFIEASPPGNIHIGAATPP
jgi:hypothetical protein